MSNDKKCAHPACNCRAKEGSDYCGTACETAGHTPDIQCNCGHPECLSKATRL